MIIIRIGYSGSDLTALCKDAALQPIRVLGGIQPLRHISIEEVRPITVKDCEGSLSQIRPSVGQASLRAYEKWNEEFGSTS